MARVCHFLDDEGEPVGIVVIRPDGRPAARPEIPIALLLQDCRLTGVVGEHLYVTDIHGCNLHATRAGDHETMEYKSLRGVFNGPKTYPWSMPAAQGSRLLVDLYLRAMGCGPIAECPPGPAVRRVHLGGGVWRELDFSRVEVDCSFVMRTRARFVFHRSAPGGGSTCVYVLHDDNTCLPQGVGVFDHAGTPGHLDWGRHEGCHEYAPPFHSVFFSTRCNSWIRHKPVGVLLPKEEVLAVVRELLSLASCCANASPGAAEQPDAGALAKRLKT